MNFQEIREWLTFLINIGIIGFLIYLAKIFYKAKKDEIEARKAENEALKAQINLLKTTHIDNLKDHIETLKAKISFLETTQVGNVTELLEKQKVFIDNQQKEYSEQIKRLVADNDAQKKLIIESFGTFEAIKDNTRSIIESLSSELLRNQEKERQRISNELFYELGEKLLVSKLILGNMEQQISPELIEDYRSLKEMVIKMIDYVRGLAIALSPMIIYHLGLHAELRNLFDKWQNNVKNIPISFDIDNIEEMFSTDDSVFIYRIFQESLTNIAKHADANHVKVSIKKQDGFVSFNIKDDGKGFNIDEVLARKAIDKGLGLAIIESRIQSMGGSLRLSSEEGKGTSLSFSLPIKKGIDKKDNSN